MSGAPMHNEAVLRLRREFDLSFAQPGRVESIDTEQLLAVRIGGDPYALRVAEIGALLVDRRIVALPGPMPELLGVAAFRGQIAPVYDLGALLGYPRRSGQRWLVLARHAHPLALTFDSFDAQLSATAERIVTLAGDRAADVMQASAPRQAVQDGDTLRPIVALAALIEDIQRRVESARYAKEP